MGEGVDGEGMKRKKDEEKIRSLRGCLKSRFGLECCYTDRGFEVIILYIAGAVPKMCVSQRF